VDVLVTVVNGALAATVMNLTLAAAAGAFVLFVLARERPMGATVAADGR